MNNKNKTVKAMCNELETRISYEQVWLTIGFQALWKQGGVNLL